jgi:hypothetical protein
MRKGQLTIFIIIGLVIVVAVGTVIFLNARLANPAYTLPQAEKVAEQAQPVQDYINNCIDIVARRGLQEIGDHGGYLSVKDIPDAKLNPSDPTEGDVLFLSPDSTYGVPYWWSMTSKNDCTGGCAFASKRPALTARQGSPSIEGQLAQYVKDNLDTCLKSFESFSADGINVQQQTDSEVKAIVTDDSVVVAVTQQFDASSTAGRNSLHQFVVTLPVHLKDIYNLATNITVLESENAFLAKHARELISVYGRTDSDALPPVGSVEFELGPGTVWVKNTVQQRIQQLLQDDVPLLQVFGTRNYRPIEVQGAVTNKDTVFNALNRNALIPELKAFPNVEARFAYLPAWKPYFDLNCNGQVCRPESMINSFGFLFGVQRYNFAYDLSYPVMVELSDPDAYNGNGYSFRFALEGNLRNNAPVTADWSALDVPQPAETTSLLCDEAQRSSGLVNITLTDSVSRKPVDGGVLFRCGAEGCVVGQTTDGKLSTRLPRCIGGRISGVQTDYVSDIADIQTGTDDSQRVDVVMHPVVALNVSAEKFRLRKDPVSQSWNFDDTPAPFGMYDQALITMVRKSDYDQEQFSTFASVCGNVLVKGAELSKDIRFTAGNYSVTISTLYHANLTIPADRRHYTIHHLLSTETKYYYVPENPIFFGNNTDNPCVSERPFPSGLMQFNWEITPAMLSRARSVLFKTVVIGAEIPGTVLKIEDLDQLRATQAYFDSERDLMTPEVRP